MDDLDVPLGFLRSIFRLNRFGLFRGGVCSVSFLILQGDLDTDRSARLDLLTVFYDGDIEEHDGVDQLVFALHSVDRAIIIVGVALGVLAQLIDNKLRAFRNLRFRAVGNDNGIGIPVRCQVLLGDEVHHDIDGEAVGLELGNVVFNNCVLDDGGSAFVVDVDQSRGGVFGSGNGCRSFCLCRRSNLLGHDGLHLDLDGLCRLDLFVVFIIEGNVDRTDVTDHGVGHGLVQGVDNLFLCDGRNGHGGSLGEGTLRGKDRDHHVFGALAEALLRHEDFLNRLFLYGLFSRQFVHQVHDGKGREGEAVECHSTGFGVEVHVDLFRQSVCKVEHERVGHTGDGISRHGDGNRGRAVRVDRAAGREAEVRGHEGLDKQLFTLGCAVIDIGQDQRLGIRLAEAAKQQLDTIRHDALGDGGDGVDVVIIRFGLKGRDTLGEGNLFGLFDGLVRGLLVFLFNFFFVFFRYDGLVCRFGRLLGIVIGGDDFLDNSILTVTDRDPGVVRDHQDQEAVGIKGVIGCRILGLEELEGDDLGTGDVGVHQGDDGVVGVLEDIQPFAADGDGELFLRIILSQHHEIAVIVVDDLDTDEVLDLIAEFLLHAGLSPGDLLVVQFCKLEAKVTDEVALDKDLDVGVCCITEDEVQTLGGCRNHGLLGRCFRLLGLGGRFRAGLSTRFRAGLSTRFGAGLSAWLGAGFSAWLGAGFSTRLGARLCSRFLARHCRGFFLYRRRIRFLYRFFCC